MKYMTTISMSISVVLWSILVLNHMYRGLNWMPLALVWVFMLFCLWAIYRIDNSKW